MGDDKSLSIILCRILSGFYTFKHNNDQYMLKYPSMSLRYTADIFVEQEFDEIKFNSWIKSEDVIYFLIEAGLWSPDGDTILSSLEKQIEDYKVELYKNYLNPARIKQLKQKLNTAKKNHSRLFNRKHSLDHITTEGYIDHIKDQYILVHSLYNMHNELIFKNFDNIDGELVNSLSYYISQNTISMDTFRALARSAKWRNYWMCNKEYLFDKPATDWTEEQQTLVLMSKMYDSAYEHPECPPDSVINDDDIFDGWLIHQRRENEKNKEKNRTEKLLKDNKLGNAKEVYLMANSKEEAAAIYNLNDPNSRNIIQERNKLVLNSQSDIKETQLPDVQRDLVTKMNQQFMQSRKK